MPRAKRRQHGTKELTFAKGLQHSTVSQMLNSHSSLKAIVSSILAYFHFPLGQSECTEYLTSQCHGADQKCSQDCNPRIPFKSQAFSNICGGLPHEIITRNIVCFAIKMALDPGLYLDTITERLSLTSPYKLHTFHPSTFYSASFLIVSII